MRRQPFLACLMLSAVLILVALSWLSMTEAAPVSGVLFTDDFESGSSQWTPVNGTWSVIVDGSQVYSQSTLTETSRSVAGSSSWSDVAVHARVKTMTGTYAMLMARYQDASHYYLMAIRTSNGKIEMKKMQPGGSVGLGSVNAGITFTTWYSATFEVVGTTLRGYINGTPVITVTDSSATPYLTGKIGLGTLDSGAEFDDVVVNSLLPDHTLTLTKAGNGTGTVTSTPSGIDCGSTCAAIYEQGTAVTLSASPTGGSSFAGWMGPCMGTGECTISMDAAKSVTAVFSSSTEPMLVVNKNGTGSGTVSSTPAGISCGATCFASFSLNDVVTLSAAAGEFSTFTGWSGASCSGTGTCAVTMDAAKSVTATFTLSSYSLTVTKTGTGTGTVSSTPPGISCGATCSAMMGGVVTLTAQADTGSSFAGWTGAGCSGTGQCVLTMNSAKNVTASFMKYLTHLPLVSLYIAPVTVAPLYVAPTGNDSNPGTIDQPFKTLTKAVSVIVPGQTVYMRGGTYNYNQTVNLNQSGNSVNMLKIWAYQNEKPVLDFSAISAGDLSRGFFIGGNYWYIKGLEIKNAPDNAIKIEGSYNIIEQCVLHHNGDSGLQIGLASTSTNPTGLLAAYNQVINCDSYRNFDPAANGGNADGFAAKLHAGKGNVFRGDRSWENSDDGWDLFDADYPVVIENSWTFHNGDPALYGGVAGNGNGFKVGGNGNHAANILKNSIAFDNRYGSGSATKGFDLNNNKSGITIYNSLAFSNTINYAFATQPDDGTHHILRNNVGFGAVTTNVNLSADTIHDHNSWDLAGVTADNFDFRSLDVNLAKAPRQANGNLPNNDFARLVAGSDLIDKGVDVGIPFLGSAPDLGAFEGY